MTTQKEYIYEVGFSFLKQDEAIAYDLNDHIQDRLSTFIYSKKQEELGVTEGEKKFNKVNSILELEKEAPKNPKRPG